MTAAHWTLRPPRAHTPAISSLWTRSSRSINQGGPKQPTARPAHTRPAPKSPSERLGAAAVGDAGWWCSRTTRRAGASCSATSLLPRWPSYTRRAHGRRHPPPAPRAPTRPAHPALVPSSSTAHRGAWCSVLLQALQSSPLANDAGGKIAPPEASAALPWGTRPGANFGGRAAAPRGVLLGVGRLRGSHFGP